MGGEEYPLCHQRTRYVGCQASMGPLKSVNQLKLNTLGPGRKTNIPSPSMIANLSAAIEKSPRTLTAVMFGIKGMAKCFPGGKA